MNPLTLKPGTYTSTKYTIPTVITNENNPSVIKVIGKLIIFKIGLTKEFKNPIASATNKAVVNPSTVIPFK